MQTFIRFASVFTALLTGACIVAFPFLSETYRPWALYIGLTALTATFAFILLMIARFMDMFIRLMRQLKEHAQRQQDGEPGT